MIIMKLLKYLPKMSKRDKVTDSISFYRAIVNDELTKCYDTKLALMTDIQNIYANKPIKNIVMQKVILQTLKS